MKLHREFFFRDTEEVARDLLGQVLVRRGPEGLTSGRIVETEAYKGLKDAACHSARGPRDGRAAAMWGPGGRAYVYLIYGMYCCMNVVTRREGEPEAVLIRAVEPLTGLDLMQERRRTAGLKKLCSGPGKLCMAMDISRQHNGADLCGDVLYLEYGEGFGPGPAGTVLFSEGPRPFEIAASRRINVDYAGEDALRLWRFTIKDSPFVSK